MSCLSLTCFSAVSPGVEEDHPAGHQYRERGGAGDPDARPVLPERQDVGHLRLHQPQRGHTVRLPQRYTQK